MRKCRRQASAPTADCPRQAPEPRRIGEVVDEIVARLELTLIEAEAIGMGPTDATA